METSILVNKEAARKLYDNGDQALKSELEQVFGPGFFNPAHEQLFKAACDAKGMAYDAIDAIELPKALSAHHDAIRAFMKLQLIIDHVNADWVPDFNNEREYKWAPWFKLGAGFGFSVSYYDCTGSVTDVGSRLRFKTEADSNKYARTLAPYYKQLLTPKS
jgi:hypothetical protein